MSATEDPILMQLSAAIETVLRGKIDRAVKLLDRIDFGGMEGETREIFQKLTYRVDTLAQQLNASVKKRDEEIEREQAELNELRERVIELRKAHIRAQRKAAEEQAEAEAAAKAVAEKKAAEAARAAASTKAPAEATAPPKPAEPSGAASAAPSAGEASKPAPAAPPADPSTPGKPPQPAAPAASAAPPRDPGQHQLKIPDRAGGAKDAAEVLRVWVADGQVCISTKSGVLQDATQVGKLLADIARVATQGSTEQSKQLYQLTGRFNVAIAEMTRQQGA